MDRIKAVLGLIDRPATWVALAAAIAWRLATEEHPRRERTRSMGRRIADASLTIFSAIFFAVVFAGPTLAFFDLPPRPFEVPVTVLWALLGEWGTKAILRTNVTDIIRAWRGK